MALSSQVFLDANVLLDLVLPDRPRAAQASEYIRRQSDGAICALSVHLAVHFGKKYGLQPPAIQEVAERLKVLPLTKEVTDWAFATMQDSDFEDALQVGCAVQQGCTIFVTSDVKLARNYDRFIEMHLLS